MAKSSRSPETTELFPVEHRSLQPKRLKNYGHVNQEAIYVAEWRRMNKETPSLLGRILAPDDGPKDFTGSYRPAFVTRRDAVIATSIVQWLATNVGDSFVRRCQKIADDARVKQLEVSLRRARQKDRDQRTPLKRRKARLDAVRAKITATTKGSQ